MKTENRNQEKLLPKQNGNSTETPNHVKATFVVGVANTLLTVLGFAFSPIGGLGMAFSFAVSFITIHIPVGILFALIGIVQHIRLRKNDFNRKTNIVLIAGIILCLTPTIIGIIMWLSCLINEGS